MATVIMSSDEVPSQKTIAALKKKGWITTADLIAAGYIAAGYAHDTDPAHSSSSNEADAIANLNFALQRFRDDRILTLCELFTHPDPQHRVDPSPVDDDIIKILDRHLLVQVDSDYLVSPECVGMLQHEGYISLGRGSATDRPGAKPQGWTSAIRNLPSTSKRVPPER